MVNTTGSVRVYKYKGYTLEGLFLVKETGQGFQRSAYLWRIYKGKVYIRSCLTRDAARRMVNRYVNEL